MSSVTDAKENETGEHGEMPTRRDFIYVATGMMGAVGVAGAVWPFIDQMRPDAAVLAAGQPIEVDASSIEDGQAITVTWRGKPYFVRKLTEAEVEAASGLGEGDMKDFVPAGDRLSGPDGTQNWVIVSANCTHLGCVPQVVENGAEGWYCPCHGSVFDMTGRILRGPAASNLPNPPFVFASESTLVIGSDQA